MPSIKNSTINSNNKFYNNQIQEEDYNKSVGLACFLKIVCQNDKCLKSKINSSVNMSKKNCQFFDINCLIVLACRLTGPEHSTAKKLTTQPTNYVIIE